MDKNVLKKFAIESRQELMEKVANKINRYFVDEEFNVNQNGEVYVLVNDNHTLRLTKSEYENRQLLVKRIKEITLEQVIEEAAYTWFNRIIAIRYMEIHDYLPLTKNNQSLGVRVLSSKDNTPDPEIMKISNLINPDLDIEFNKEYYGTIQDNNKRFEYILLLVCKKLGKVIPQVFDGITDYIDILIPDNLLNDSGYIAKLLKEISIDNFSEVEVIGWLYQYYISEKKDEIFEKIKNNKKVSKENIPAATQLFTPDWIVKYLVENSLGKYWIQHNGDPNIGENWKFLLKDNIQKENEKIDVTEIKILDPCCGSGHILVYVFEVLYKIYESMGYEKSEIPEMIIKNNIYGIDIDGRAVQLSILSLILKAREYDKYIFRKPILQDINIINVIDSNDIRAEDIEIFNNKELKEKAQRLIEKFEDATEVGSLLSTEHENYDELRQAIINDNTIFSIDIKNKMIPLIKFEEILTKKYEIVITNPPYMSKRVYEKKLANYLEKKYPISKYDLYTAFITKNLDDFCCENGYVSMITIHTWMFISMYESLREKILKEYYIDSMLHLGASTFEELNSFNVLATAFCIKKTKSLEKKGVYIKLDKYLSSEEKIKNFCNEKEKYMVKQSDFFSVVGQPIVYWMTENERNIFKCNDIVRNQGIIKQGMATSDNNRFLRFWTEVDVNKIGFGMHDNYEAQKSGKKWFPYNKGGDFRKWYGNNELVVNWENDGEEMKEYTSHLPQGTAVRLKSQDFYFRNGITWSLFGFENFGVRYKEDGYIFDISGSSMFFDDEEEMKRMIAYLSSKVAFQFLTYIAPTVNFQIKNIGDLPYKNDIEHSDEIIKLVDENILIAKNDWDENETSWNFKHLFANGEKYNKIKEWVDNYIYNYQSNYTKLKNNEERINEIYIELFNLTNIDKFVVDRDVSIKIINKLEIVKKLISYSVGCMFGRYSLDEDGLIYAGGNYDKNRYKLFESDTDNIIPLTEDNYFGDDIVSRFKKFIEIAYGKETLYENLEFIAETLGRKNGENSEETIRRYFINDFYDDHVKMYQKRPIYWLFDSGKKNGFKCLIYMHRYNEGLVSKIRLDYLHRMQNTYEKELKEITDKLNNDVDLTSKRELSKRQADISAKLQETNEYDEKIAHIADQKIKIDLDDGVAVNYAKFSIKNPKTGKDESILAKIK